MIGLLTVGKKAMTVGYRRYGVRGALAMGVLTVVGYVLLRRALDRAADSERVATAVDVETIQSAVDDQGVGAVADPGTLGEAVNPGNVGDAIRGGDAQSIEFDDDESDSTQ
ncbi:hypothetical protein C483_16151 [Natrialba hulunbeirensis JCM 10989]|uniref:Uncharacterized protein n=1 Tax=Natrialba hulunbeirensis JCM 10989 TaxID=1227493 RepID=L9ZQ98_9EURY|nr:hypothetical protein [Natrialba hulunbeirensis]ELY88261.1 hypothetical protein C483_16151 [Natrialba hulunbeirensis JCM 10989]